MNLISAHKNDILNLAMWVDRNNTLKNRTFYEAILTAMYLIIHSDMNKCSMTYLILVHAVLSSGFTP